MSRVNESDLPKEVIELRDLIVSRLVDAGFQKDEETYGFDMVYSYPCAAKPSSRPSVFIIYHYQDYDSSRVKKGYYVNAHFRGILIGWDSGWSCNTPRKPFIKCDNDSFEGQSVDSIRLDMLDAWIKNQKELVTLFDKFDKDFKKLHNKKGRK